MKNQVLANVLWALATVRFYSQAIMDAFRDELIHRMHSLQFKEVSNIMWAFSKLGYHPQADLLLVFNDFVEHNVSRRASHHLLTILTMQNDVYYISRESCHGLQRRV